jgi:hypothetical protein
MEARRMKLRLTRNQKAYQEQVLAEHGFTLRFSPSAHLVNDLAVELNETRCELVRLRSRTLVQVVRDWWRG